MDLLPKSSDTKNISVAIVVTMIEFLKILHFVKTHLYLLLLLPIKNPYLTDIDIFKNCLGLT